MQCNIKFTIIDCQSVTVDCQYIEVLPICQFYSLNHFFSMFVFRFDAVMQFRDRVSVYLINGHPIDKIEVLVLGGTWTEYPRPYQEEFIRDLFYAANTTFEAREERLSLKEEISFNMDAQAKIIGITLETRPDTINLEEVCIVLAFSTR